MNESKENIIIIFVTSPSDEISQLLANALVGKKIVACVNILPGIQSVYRWQEKIENTKEQILLIKTSTDNFTRVEAAIQELHPYDTPEILAVEASRVSDKYGQWVLDSCQTTS